MDEIMDNLNMEPSCCAWCGSPATKLVRMERDVNILLWFECFDCGGEHIECYSMDSKGITPSEGEE